LFKIIFAVHKKAATVNKIVSGKKIQAFQKSVFSNASCFLPPKLISTWAPSLKTRSLQNVHNFKFIPCNSLKSLLEVQASFFSSGLKGYLQSPEKQTRDSWL